jgi:hypothetical protein
VVEIDVILDKLEDVLDLNHDISASGAALTDFILTERKIELVGEGHRFFDLVRTKKAARNNWIYSWKK